MGPERTGTPFRFFFGSRNGVPVHFYRNSSQQCIRKCYHNSGVPRSWFKRQLDRDQYGLQPTQMKIPRTAPALTAGCQPYCGGPTVWKQRTCSKGIKSNHSTKRCKMLLKISILVAPLHVQQLKSFQLQGGASPPDQGLCPWTPLGAPPPDPRYRLALPRSPCAGVPVLFLLGLQP